MPIERAHDERHSHREELATPLHPDQHPQLDVRLQWVPQCLQCVIHSPGYHYAYAQTHICIHKSTHIFQLQTMKSLFGASSLPSWSLQTSSAVHSLIRYPLFCALSCFTAFSELHHCLHSTPTPLPPFIFDNIFYPPHVSIPRASCAILSRQVHKVGILRIFLCLFHVRRAAAVLSQNIPALAEHIPMRDEKSGDRKSEFS